MKEVTVLIVALLVFAIWAIAIAIGLGKHR
jgi:hypothetical protein